MCVREWSLIMRDEHTKLINACVGTPGLSCHCTGTSSKSLCSINICPHAHTRPHLSIEVCIVLFYKDCIVWYGLRPNGSGVGVPKKHTHKNTHTHWHVCLRKTAESPTAHSEAGQRMCVDVICNITELQKFCWSTCSCNRSTSTWTLISASVWLFPECNQWQLPKLDVDSIRTVFDVLEELYYFFEANRFT